MPLHACSGCRRHVRAQDASCPFCGQAQDRGLFSRIALGGAVVAGTLIVGATQGMRALYGGPPPSLHSPHPSPVVSASPDDEASTPATPGVPAYGVPPAWRPSPIPHTPPGDS